ncbi:hypothetical protein MSAN_00954700 [Mycena sanguinolenta]|uniref:Cyanovirin-N domain-containing protein n=1 Tax=Mycena sanguinolenta TaxID=230812 RepID=A0A8H6YTM9_9AGAR|nr:hypothetical protein MSAN_00954600 [Mycena sanguinolenta]KAF7366960.1 hypothetical protein MSAN_00954700 [Mycena sanguinolenta]
MFFSKKALALLASLLVVETLAAPTDVKSDAALADGTVFYCTAVGFTGTCATDNFTVNVCQNVQFLNQVSSFQPSLGGACFVFTGTGCTGAWIQLFSPLSQGVLGSSDLRGVGSAGTVFNDHLNSYFCTTGFSV